MKKLNTYENLKKLVGSHYMQGKTASFFNQKIAWVSSGAPVEVLRPFDIVTIYPENHASICGAAKKGPELCEAAEAEGYSRDLCSYFRCDRGSTLLGTSPIGGLPRPDFLFGCNNICGTILKWYEIASRHYDVPFLFVDTPFVHTTITDHAVDYVAAQLQETIPRLESLTGREFEGQKFMRTLELSKKCVELWKKTLQFGAHKPSPLTCFDAFTQMAAIVSLRGTEEAVTHYEALNQELESRVQKGIAAVDNEKIRLLWDNIPVWYAMRGLSELFEKYHACLVADTYTNAWASAALDTGNPMESLARNYLEIYLNISMDLMLERIVTLVHQFDVDGMVMHSNRSCKPYSLGQYDLAGRIKEETGIPVVIIEADMVDSRSYAEEQVRTRIEAFLESLGE
jgi:benzoyl-CoA reductase/2-hydroxyglutaryl-CoA dehydratase subunit BcrC/BadD/HgdB